MTDADLKKFCHDLHVAKIEARMNPSISGQKMWSMSIHGVNFYFWKDDTKQYDGWGSRRADILHDVESGEFKFRQTEASGDGG